MLVANTVAICGIALMLALAGMLAGLRSAKAGGSVAAWIAHTITTGLSKTTFAVLHLFTRLGVDMSVVDEAIARFTAFTRSVLDQLAAAKAANDAQTGKLADLQTALDAALADDNIDKATISTLQGQILRLQNEVANQIDAALANLQAPPTAPEAEAEAPVAEPEPVVEETPAPVEEATPEVVEEPATVEPEVAPEPEAEPEVPASE